MGSLVAARLSWPAALGVGVVSVVALVLFGVLFLVIALGVWAIAQLSRDWLAELWFTRGRKPVLGPPSDFSRGA